MLLQLKNITKRFPGILANDHITFDVRQGEIHAIVGENGAGKTTLMNILYGLYRPDEGDIFSERHAGAVSFSQRRHRLRYRDGAPAFHANSFAHGHGEYHFGHENPAR